MISSDQRHAFDVPPEALWEAMARVGTYREWWPWLRSFSATGLVPGDRWVAIVQPPLPYRLRFDLIIEEVEAPRTVSAQVVGDIEGTARIDIEATPTGSELHLMSELAPANALLRAVAQVAHPMVRFGHEWILDTGLRQFRDRALSLP